jgi:hypothetical protein
MQDLVDRDCSVSVRKNKINQKTTTHTTGFQVSMGQGAQGSSKVLIYLGFTHTNTDTDTEFSTYISHAGVGTLKR